MPVWPKSRPRISRSPSPDPTLQAAPGPFGAAPVPSSERSITEEKRRRSAGETAFNAVLFVLSLVLMWQAHAIAGFLSPDALPVVVVPASDVILLNCLRMPERDGTRFSTDILPLTVIVMMLFIAGYAVLLHPLGFLPTSFPFVFLALSIPYLQKGGLQFAIGVTVFSLLLVYVVFRLVFTVPMPSGIVPQAEILSALRGILEGMF